MRSIIRVGGWLSGFFATALLISIGVARASNEGDDSSISTDSSDGTFSINLGGFIRSETAVSTGDENPNNQRGNIFNDRDVARQAYLPPKMISDIAGGSLPAIPGLALPATGDWTTVPLGTVGFQDTVRRPIPDSSNRFNMHILRAETEVDLKYGSHWGIIGRARGIYDPGHYSEFDASSVSGLQGGISGGNPSLYAGNPNYFQYQVEGSNHPNPLEWSGRNYMVYFPALILEYTQGPLDVRVGSQQIAWGQAIFFRVLDVPDGIDYRRHFILDRAVEEYGDKRVPAPSIRATYQMTDNILLDGYFQKFQPTIYPNPNTAYNIIPSQFTVHDLYEQGEYNKKFSYGLRMKGDYGKWGFQAVAARRYNPDGVFRWTESGVNRNLPNTGLGQLVNLAYAAPGHMYSSTGEALSHTPFEVAPGGVYSANEWYNYAAQARLNGTAGLNSSIAEFAASQDLFASVVDNQAQATNELNTFFMAAGGSLRGHIAREYFQETNIGGGVSYVTESTAGSFLDQLIFNLEAMYVPDRTFTNPSLSRDYLHQKEWTVGLVADKWHRFFDEFPGTYIVMQAMHKTKSDLVGRSLQGYDGSEDKAAGGLSGGSNYFVMAFLQPFPNQIYQIEFATLYDFKGGVLAQPGLRWKPTGPLTVEASYNYLNGHFNGNPNSNVISSVDFANEFTLRLAYQFSL